MALNNELAVIIPFLADESNAFHAQLGKVRGVHYPESEADIVEIMKNAGDKITVSGAGTGLTGSRVPMHGGIVVSMEKMLRAEMRNDCREIVREGLAGKIRIYLDDEKNIAHVAPGVSLSELTAALPDNLIYPPDPTETLASLGGTVATNASGARCFHYGPTRNWIVGLRIILTDSEVLAIRRGECFADQNRMLDFNSESGKKYSIRIPDYHMPSVKNAAGLYSKPGMDLIDLFIGSEGILGITTEITIKLQPSEKEPVSDLAFFSTDENALNYVNALRPMKNRGILAIEYFDGNALNFIRDQHPDIPPNAAAAILVEMKGEALDILTELSDMLAANNALADWCATNSPDRRDMKEFRHSLPDSVNTYLKQHDSYKLGTDFAVPAEKFPEMMERYRNAGRKFRAKFPRDGPHFVIFGHIGDCHVHFNFITAGEEERTFAKQLYLELANAAVEMGGTISGEHGVGKKVMQRQGREIPYLELMYGESGLREIARVKAVLDPDGVLNAGNMVPTNYQT